MNPQFDNLMVAAYDQTVLIQIHGKASFGSSIDLKRLINELRSRGTVRFVFDLSACTMMDSTFLGLLSGIGLEFAHDKTVARTINLYNPNDRIAETIEGLGVAQLFTICNGDAAGQREFKALEHTEADRVDVTRTCLEAHNTLIEINPDNARKFKEVTRFLAEDLKRLESAGN